MSWVSYMDPERRKDIEDVRREETARGTRQRVPGEDAVRERKLRLELMRELLQIEDRESVVRVLTDDYGLQAQSAEYKTVLQVWSEHRRSRP